MLVSITNRQLLVNMYNNKARFTSQHRLLVTKKVLPEGVPPWNGELYWKLSLYSGLHQPDTYRVPWLTSSNLNQILDNASFKSIESHIVKNR